MLKVENVEEAPVFQREYGTLTLLAGPSHNSIHSRKVDFKKIIVREGCSTSHHMHLGRESIFHFVGGEGEMISIEGCRSQVVRAGDTVVIPAGVDHQVRNLGRGELVFFESESPPHSTRDKILVGQGANLSPATRQGRLWQRGASCRLKICGVKSLDAAFECHRLGVDAIGLHAIGRRGIEVAIGWADWVRIIPADLSVVVLVDTTDKHILGSLVEALRVDTVQLQGEQAVQDVRAAAGFLRGAGYRFVRSVAAGSQVEPERVVEELAALEDVVDGFLMDAACYGGTGRRADWALVKRVSSRIRVPILLAGGINAENLGRAVTMISPFAIDVESGSEIRLDDGSARGVSVKSFEKIGELVARLRKAQAS